MVARAPLLASQSWIKSTHRSIEFTDETESRKNLFVHRKMNLHFLKDSVFIGYNWSPDLGGHNHHQPSEKSPKLEVA